MLPNAPLAPATSLADLPVWILVAAGVSLFLLVSMVGFVTSYRRGLDGGSRSTRAAHAAPTHAVTVELVDAVTGDPVALDGTVEAVKQARDSVPRRGRRTRGPPTGGGKPDAESSDESDEDGEDQESRRRTALEDGSATLHVAPGAWRFEVEAAGEALEKVVQVRDDATVTVTAPPLELGVRCLDAADREPVASATVTCRTSTGDDRTATTDADGDACFELPRRVTAADVAVERDGYERATRLVKLDGELVGVEFELLPS